MLWPDETQMLLLHACLGEGAGALAAFEQWCARIDFDGPIEAGSARLLPLAHANLARLGGDHPRMGLIRGLRRRTWVETQLRSREAAAALGLLGGAGLRTMVAKGLPLALHYYGRPGLRPMADIDVLVDKEQAVAAMRLLESAGWRSAQPEMTGRPGYLIQARHAVPFIGPKGGELDLHWHLLHESMTADTGRRFWEGAVPIDIGGIATLRPGPTHMLMHVLVHGMRADLIAPLRWIPDAIMILRRDMAAVDWDELLGFARRARLLSRLAPALQFLRNVFMVPIPDEILVEARRARPSLVEMLERARVIGEGAAQPGRTAQSGYLLARAIRLAQSERRAELPGVAARWLLRRFVGPRISS